METGGAHSWGSRYVSLNGTIRKTLRPQGDTLQIQVTTQSGSISMNIQDADGNVVFEQRDMGTGSFQVPVSGKATVTVTADHHKGSFSVE